MSDKDNKPDPKDGDDRSTQDGSADDLSVQLSKLQESFAGFSSIQPPSATRIGADTARLYDWYNDLHTLAAQIFPAVARLHDQFAKKLEEAQANAEGERKAREAASRRVSELEENFDQLNKKYEDVLRRFKAFEVEKNELGQRLVNLKPFLLTFAYVVSVCSAMMEHEEGFTPGSDPFLRIELDDLMNNMVLVAQNRHAQIRFSDNNSTWNLEIRRLHPNTGQPATKWLGAGPIAHAECLTEQQLMIIAGVLELPNSSLPREKLDAYRLPGLVDAMGKLALGAAATKVVEHNDGQTGEDGTTK